MSNMRSRSLLTASTGLWKPTSTMFRSPLQSSYRTSVLFPSRPCRTIPVRFTSTTNSPSASRIVRPLVPPPDEGSGPLLSRRGDRELPRLPKTGIWVKTLPIFFVLVAASSLAIFNYQKSTSSTVSSIMYALRTNETAREILGDEIYFASKTPWIRGELNQLHGTIDISFWVKGTKSQALTRFVSLRKKGSYFETMEWSLTDSTGKTWQLLTTDGRDPMSLERS
ncbi:hypothetical protein PV10_08050 [Exophiala mesophila]|uniref:DUF1783-domain-containing protein n=1 Tax=Exophiala mesophila TaxID=212818 RepID=A0A0D1Z364_EXOME|nr:uncharacterized protein PV10_08050 [Exophiala mesophila]KIV88359.1 hypothetical protein PV10_08050 [Exophiala mesophila]